MPTLRHPIKIKGKNGAPDQWRLIGKNKPKSGVQWVSCGGRKDGGGGGGGGASRSGRSIKTKTFFMTVDWFHRGDTIFDLIKFLTPQYVAFTRPCRPNWRPDYLVDFPSVTDFTSSNDNPTTSLHVTLKDSLNFYQWISSGMMGDPDR